MENQAKPTEIRLLRQFDGKYGTQFVFFIQFSDGVKGEYTSTKNPQDKFEVGTMVTYSATTTKNKKTGEDYLKIKPVVPQHQSSGNKSTGYSRKKSPEVQRSIIASVCLECANMVAIRFELQNEIKPNLKSLHALSDKFYDHIIKKCGYDDQLLINYQSRLKEVCTYFFDYKELNITNSDRILEYVDMEVAYLKSKMG